MYSDVDKCDIFLYLYFVYGLRGGGSRTVCVCFVRSLQKKLDFPLVLV